MTYTEDLIRGLRIRRHLAEQRQRSSMWGVFVLLLWGALFIGWSAAHYRTTEVVIASGIIGAAVCIHLYRAAAENWIENDIIDTQRVVDSE